MKTLAETIEALEDEFTFDLPDIQGLEKETIMVTGAGGSIGSTICTSLVKLGVKNIILLDNSEYNLYAIHRELKLLGVEAVPYLGSYGDVELLSDIFYDNKPTIVYHAGAYKHVPLCELNWRTAYRNNVKAATRLFNRCAEFGIPKVVIISSDKAVNPTSFMGVTKLLVEQVAFKILGPEVATVVRFGNVLGSSGSVVPLFYSQLLKTGRVTITHPAVMRYFMTLKQASYLVLRCGQLEGERFLLNMGEPIPILNIANSIANILGLDLKYDVIGLRDGEKMWEDLTLDSDAELIEGGKIYRVNEPLFSSEELAPILKLLEGRSSYSEVKRRLSGGILGWTPTASTEVASLKYKKGVEDCFYVNQ